MNNQNYRQNLRNPAGKPSADEPPQTQAESRKQEQPSNSRQNGPGQGGYRPGGLRFPIGNQQPYHAGPQPGSQQGGQPSQNGPQQSGQASQNGPQQAGQTPQNAFQQGNQTFQNDSRQNNQSFQNGSRQNTPPFRNGSQQGSRPFQNGSQQGNPGSSGQDSTAESTASSSGASESASSAAEDTSESADSHSGHNMDGHSASADQNLKSYLADQDRQMDQMMTGMQGIPQSGSASVDFLTGMIPHHQAAVDMAESYLKYGGENKELKELAENIIEVQREEIDQMEKMAGSLKEKGTHNEDQAKAYRQEYDKMFEDGAHGHHMPDSSPATVDEAFAEGMMMHHQMAVDMARSILEYTDNEEVTQLANGHRRAAGGGDLPR